MRDQRALPVWPRALAQRQQVSRRLVLRQRAVVALPQARATRQRLVSPEPAERPAAKARVDRPPELPTARRARQADRFAPVLSACRSSPLSALLV